jgi:hypothetical protein
LSFLDLFRDKMIKKNKKTLLRTAIFGGNRKWGRRLLQTLSRKAESACFKEVC